MESAWRLACFVVMRRTSTRARAVTSVALVAMLAGGIGMTATRVAQQQFNLSVWGHDDYPKRDIGTHGGIRQPLLTRMRHIVERKIS